jgi:hypothetical protein
MEAVHLHDLVGPLLRRTDLITERGVGPVLNIPEIAREILIAHGHPEIIELFEDEEYDSRVRRRSLFQYYAGDVPSAILSVTDLRDRYTENQSNNMQMVRCYLELVGPHPTNVERSVASMVINEHTNELDLCVLAREVITRTPK